MKCGIVILNYNTYELTCSLVKSCMNIESIGKIVIVDNCSNDNFDEFCKELNDDKIKYIKNNKNTGYAAGNNIGLRYLKDNGYKYAFIANPDVIFTEKTIIEIKNFLEKNCDYGVVSCLRTLNKTKNTGQYWWIPTFKSALLESTYIGRHYLNKRCIRLTNDTNKILGKVYDTVEVVGGAFFGCNLDIMEKINYLDENTFLWYEENILAFKLRENGYKEAILYTCEYEHNHKKKQRGNKNFNIYLKSKKHYCKTYLKINMFQTILLNIFDFIGNIEAKLIYLLFN